MLVDEFDPNPIALINPKDTVTAVPGMPPQAIGVFSAAIVAQAVAEYGGKIIAEIRACCGNNPIYQIEQAGKVYALFTAFVGGPMIVGAMEELHAMGVKSFVLFGSCGVLDKALDHGSIIVPTKAARDEGVSYHYLPAADFVELSYVPETIKAMETLQYPYVAGPVWTTDAVYRETAKRAQKRRAQGCIAVEMECACAAAMAQFRGVPFAQFIFAADNLDSPLWERRTLGDGGLPGYQRYMTAAFAISDAIQAKEVVKFANTP